IGEILAAPLDQPVGVHEHDVADVESHLALNVLRTVLVARKAQGRSLGGWGISTVPVLARRIRIGGWPAVA
ncbi:MAG: hypothetical protein ACRD4I_06595, partial [Candidatus Angelobacter sp.]